VQRKEFLCRIGNRAGIKVESHAAGSAAELNEDLLSQMAEYCGGQFHDDATLVVVAAN